ncbi:hypothetical protein [Deinococcus humi]|uniref:Uncharacterized protein n=1 Tax=Deinococcus humi TaxID=662880 RepID=A0A7W8JY43_9DEIO|nr:hypothetical protein [Deinococcus humi]MBB5365375.1 hypothetical protein [Deinococcus humi]GGO36137.1 hypothetical protein GCM10008949_39600 [Deinococcus humi]
METYRILIDAVAEARKEVNALLSSAPAQTVVKQSFSSKPLLLGEDTYYSLDVMLAGAHAAEFSSRLKQRYTTDMQRIA